MGKAAKRKSLKSSRRRSGQEVTQKKLSASSQIWSDKFEVIKIIESQVEKIYASFEKSYDPQVWGFFYCLIKDIDDIKFLFFDKGNFLKLAADISESLIPGKVIELVNDCDYLVGEIPFCVSTNDGWVYIKLTRLECKVYYPNINDCGIDPQMLVDLDSKLAYRIARSNKEYALKLQARTKELYEKQALLLASLV